MAVVNHTPSNRFQLQFDRYINGERVRKTKLLPKGIDKSHAEILDKKFEAEIYTKHNLIKLDDEWINYVNKISEKGEWIEITLRHLKHRAKIRKQTCNIDHEYLKNLLLESKGRCQITGLKFNKDKYNNKTPFFHSVDRIRSNLGYVKGNCRIVCYAVNIAMLNWGEEVFKELVIGYAMNRYAAYMV